MTKWLAVDVYGQTHLRNDIEVPEGALADLATSQHYLVREAAAERMNDSDALAMLSADKTSSVRAAVAANSDTPEPVLDRLVKDRNAGVRQGVAQNPTTPPEMLSSLARDDHPGVRMVVADNPRLRADARATMDI